MQGLIGKKIGMTQVWDKDGVRVPVTVLEAGPCPVVQVKTVEKDGYAAVQLGWGPQKESRLSKAEVGHAKKAGVAAVRVLREFAADEGEAVEAGKVYTAKDVFEGVAFVDVIGVSKGKGFMGVMRRHGFAGGGYAPAVNFAAVSGRGGQSKSISIPEAPAPITTTRNSISTL